MRTSIHVDETHQATGALRRALTTAVVSALGAIWCGAVLASSSLDSVRASQPEPDHSPEEVVQLQLTALGLNQELGENGGIEIAFRFASPTNKLATGPISKFIGILQNPQYKPMLEYESVEFGESRTKDDEVGVMVKLTLGSGENAGYVFVLSRQSGEPCACWMTDRVVRIPLENDAATSGSSI